MDFYKYNVPVYILHDLKRVQTDRLTHKMEKYYKLKV